MLAFLRNYDAGPIAVRFPKKEFASFDLPAALKVADTKYNPFSAVSLAKGTQVLILSEGVFAAHALAARELLAKAKISAEVMDVRSLRPLPLAQILRALKGKKLLVTLENHGLTGGLADLLAAALRGQKTRPPHLALGYPEEVVPHGSIAEIEDMYGLSPAKIAARIGKAFR
jgi:deoxyxylulose-5-phosphate synthase